MTQYRVNIVCTRGAQHNSPQEMPVFDSMEAAEMFVTEVENVCFYTGFKCKAAIVPVGKSLHQVDEIGADMRLEACEMIEAQ